MRLNLALREALEAWGREAKSAEAPAPAKTEVVRSGAILARPAERVVGGEVLWKPVDRVAWRVVAAAPWWAKPPEVTVKAPEPPVQLKTKKPRKRKHMRKESKDPIGSDPLDTASIEAMVHEMIHASKLPQESLATMNAAQLVNRTVKELLYELAGVMEEFTAKSRLWTEDIRQLRFYTVTECETMFKSLREVRQFFVGPDYKEEQARLKEFVELCERLNALKQTGFLDTVADTMLRLAVGGGRS